MKFIIPLLVLVAVCSAAPQQAQPQFNYQNYLASQTTTTPAPVHPPASIHYVNIGQELNGDYKFGYDTGKGPSGQSFREETRLPDGSVKGQYGYLDAQNKMRIVKYTAGLNGFSIDSDTALNDQQIAASRPTAPSPQYNPAPAAEQPRSQYNSQQYSSARQSFQGLAQAAQQQYQAYLPPPTAQAQQPYTGYAQPQPAQYQPAPQPAPQAAAPQYAPPQYNANAYGSASQLTPAQLQAQALASARARQAALARQQQQEAIIRQQQQAATEQILAQQRAALEAQQATQQAESAAQKQSNYQNLASQYAAAQPAYQPQPQYQPAPAPAPAPAQPAPPTYQSPQYQPASQPAAYSSGGSRTTELKPDVLSQFIQLPGTRLIQIDKPRPAKPAISSSLLSSSSSSAKSDEEEYTGPVVINAALLNYDIGSTKLPNGQPANNKRRA